MKVSLNVDPCVDGTEIVISCKRLTPEIENLIASLHILDRQMTAVKDGETFILDVDKIIYTESVDRRTFIYTADDCFESKLKLYEIEQQLCDCNFIRTAKACLVNLKYVRSLKNDFNHKLQITLENGEKIIVSRQYADEFKKRLGVG